MKRLLLEVVPEVGQAFDPPEEERRHLQDVRRTKVGEILELIDGQGALALGKVISVGRNEMRVQVLEHLESVRESPLDLIMGLAIPSQLSTFDTLLPSLVQLGVNQLLLAPTTWGGRIKKNPERYHSRVQTIAEQALKQCGRLQAPAIHFLKDYPAMLALMAEKAQTNLIFHPVEGATEMPESCSSLGLLVGPEGGFTPEEVAEATALGFLVKGLGPRILKMETAAIGACFQAQSRYGDL